MGRSHGGKSILKFQTIIKLKNKILNVRFSDFSRKNCKTLAEGQDPAFHPVIKVSVFVCRRLIL
jgi:hypothetical protein